MVCEALARGSSVHGPGHDADASADTRSGTGVEAGADAAAATLGGVMLNQLEPVRLIRSFLEHAPGDFRVFRTTLGLPAFIAEFDLLTTMDAALRLKVTRLPLYRWWGRLLRPRTFFAGTTVSEYVLLPTDTDSPALVSHLLREHAPQHPFLIIKDIPQDSPLLSSEANRHADNLVRHCREQGFVIIEGQALAWVPVDFSSSAEYIERLSPGRRKNLRRKLKKREGLQIEELATGNPCFDDTLLLAEFYRLYLNVHAQSEIHFDCLTQDFFSSVLQDGESGGVVFVYRRDGHLIGYNLCYVQAGMLLDKYIGLSYPEARENNLYFISWFHNLDYACRQGLSCYVAGWTDPEVKSFLGAHFTFTRHAVYIRNPLLRSLLRRFSRHFESDREWRDSLLSHQAGTVADMAKEPGA
jgi:hypothetical protein